MTERKDDGGPAFAASSEQTHQNGMTLRDYFAAKAMQVAYQQYHADAMRPKDEGFYTNTSEVAKVAYDMADAMIAAGSRPPKR